MDSTISPLPVGTELGDEFRVEKNLGQGGFGITYLVRALKDIEDLVETGSLYVVKEFAMNGYVRRADDSARITPLGEDDATREQAWALFTKFRDSFRQEALTMAMFQHRNIVEVLLVRAANETAYIIMEYINGDALLDRVMESIRLQRRGMSWPELEPIAHQTLEALEYIHLRDIIHRDIKPDNIMLRRNGDAVLIDFGGARPKARANMSIIYTPGFAPAEQFRKSPEDELPEVSRTTDIFSLAASFYMAMTGETPYTLDERRMPVAAREPLLGHSNQQALQIPDDVARAIDWALNFGDPTKRPQSVEDWRRAFPPQGQPVTPPTPPSPVPQTPQQQTVTVDVPTEDSATIANTLVREEIKKSRISTMVGLTMAGVATIAALGALFAFYFFDSNPAQPYAARVTIDETWVSLGDALQSAGLPIRGENAISTIEGLTLSELENSERTTTVALSSDDPFRIRFEQAGETLVMLIREGSDIPKLSSGQLSNLEVRAEEGEAELYLVNSDFVDSLS